MLPTYIFAIALPVAAGLAGTPTTPPAAAPEAGPAARFAADLVHRTQHGWHIRGLDIQEAGDTLTLAVTLADESEARLQALTYSADGYVPLGYHTEAIARPAETRVYPVERELVALIARGGPGMIQAECDSYYLENDAGTAILDPDAYYVVRERVSGPGAASAASTAILDGLAAGMELVAVHAVRDGGDQAIELELAGDDTRVVHVGTDARGRVQEVEVRRSPVTHPWQRYRGTRQLMKALRQGRGIYSLTLDPAMNGSGVLYGVMRGVRFQIALDDFFSDENEECGC